MKKQKQKFNFKPLAVMLALSILLFFGNSAEYLLAQGPGYGSPGAAPDDIPEDEEEANVVCQDNMDDFASNELMLYMEWMETHFQNKSSTTTLLDDAVGKYKQLRTTLIIEYDKYIPHQYGLLLIEGLERSECRQIVDDTLEEAKRLLERKSKTTSNVKKVTALLNKYQEINGKLSKLSRDFVTMRKHLDTFAAKLPCYIKRSCNKS
jgi:hypothetical protein